MFDVTTLAAYREVPDVVVEDDDRLVRWRSAPAELRRLAEEAGLEVAAVLGQRPGAVFDNTLDERVHRKAAFVI